MEQDSTTQGVDPSLVTRIVASYVRHHEVGVDQLAGLIAEVHRTLGDLRRVALPEEPRVPAVPVMRSVRGDYVVCLDCGHRGVILRQHIRVAHGLEPAAYRTRWKLSADHPLTAPSYSARHSAMAKQLGLGHLRRRKAVLPASVPVPALPKRRGRPRKQPSSTA
jgi:predicted transcriptional regulator